MTILPNKDDEVELIKLQFLLVARTYKRIIDASGEVKPITLSTEVEGMKITAMIGVTRE